MPWLLDKLAEHYKSAEIAFPSLKSVTLAQWILESGHAKSALAMDHRNFAGLKWRNDMVGWATPVEYGANDGVDTYCKFIGIDAFIAGYWHFLSRSPYHGWEEQAAINPEAFITFIGHKFNPAHPEYVDRILALVPEAETLLNKF
jgi:N-acetylmuramoyl-L-alanine amidase